MLGASSYQQRAAGSTNMPSETTPPDPETPGVALVSGDLVGSGRYTLKSLLDHGGMGVVWRAHDERLREEVALKFLPAHIRFDSVALAAMRRETLKSRKLTHPNIIRIHDLHEFAEEAPFISMEYVDGGNLHAFQDTQPGRLFPWPKLLPLLAQLCDALDYAHAEKVIHRDLKPANMMLDSRGRLKLADFGIAAVISGSAARLSGHHPSSGTVTYMSPQQMTGQTPQVTDDIYALGATLYELLAGTPPFYTGDIAHQVQNIAPPHLGQRLAEHGLANAVPPDVSALIMACLAKDPARRPQSARAVREWIGFAKPEPHQSLIGHVTNPAKEMSSEDGRATELIVLDTPRINSRWLARGLVALVFVSAAVWYWRTDHPRKTNQVSAQTNAPGAAVTNPTGTESEAPEKIPE